MVKYGKYQKLWLDTYGTIRVDDWRLCRVPEEEDDEDEEDEEEMLGGQRRRPRKRVTNRRRVRPGSGVTCRRLHMYVAFDATQAESCNAARSARRGVG